MNLTDYFELVLLVQNSLWAAALLGLVGGLVSTFVNYRDVSFAVHGISELSFAGAAIALLVGFDVITGSIIGSISAAVILGFIGSKAKERNSTIAVLMPFGLGVGILALALYQGRAANKFGLLTGQIVAVDDPQLISLAIICGVVIVGLLLIWRPLTFASLDPDVAAAKGVPVRALSIGFMLLLGLAVAASVQVVGALLVLSLLVTPAAAAMKVSRSLRIVPLLSIAFALIAAVGGILLALPWGLPISPFVTTVSFVIYALCAGLEKLRGR